MKACFIGGVSPSYLSLASWVLDQADKSCVMVCVENNDDVVEKIKKEIEHAGLGSLIVLDSLSRVPTVPDVLELKNHELVPVPEPVILTKDRPNWCHGNDKPWRRKRKR